MKYEYKIGISGYIGKRKTGIGRVLENILKSMAKLAPHVNFKLFINYNQNDLIKIQWPKNVDLIKYPISKDRPILNIIWHQYSFQRWLKKSGCTHSLIPNFSLLLWKNVHTVVIIHDLIEFIVPNKFSKIRVMYRKIIVPLMAKKSDKIITVSKSTKKDIMHILKIEENKIVVIPNAFDNQLFKLIDDYDIIKFLSKFNLEFKAYILYVGTVDHPGKNLYSLIKAFFQLKKERKITEKLVVVGTMGHNADYILDFVKSSKYCDEIIFIGYAEDDDLPLFYNGAVLFSLLSLYEGFGLPVLESMACGCPVIASNTSAFPELIGAAGLLVNPRDIEQIKDAIYNLLSSEALQNKLRTLGLLRAKNYSWERSAKLYLKYLGE